MNCIISTYLTTAFDLQRGVRKGLNDEQYIQKWYESIVNLGLNGIILHDGLYRWFMDDFPKVKFIEVPPVGEYQLYDYRWILYRNYLRTHPGIENVFFTDISDVQVVLNPFTQKLYDPDYLYCGDEPETIGQNGWIKHSLGGLLSLPGYLELINSNRPLLNCGIFGGGRDIVLQFLSRLIPLIEQMKFRKIDATVDMPLYNYVAQDFNMIHGHPVNSLFKGYENRNDCWFIHK
jgi:hypothetical protein